MNLVSQDDLSCRMSDTCNNYIPSRGRVWVCKCRSRVCYESVALASLFLNAVAIVSCLCADLVDESREEQLAARKSGQHSASAGAPRPAISSTISRKNSDGEGVKHVVV